MLITICKKVKVPCSIYSVTIVSRTKIMARNIDSKLCNLMMANSRLHYSTATNDSVNSIERNDPSSDTSTHSIPSPSNDHGATPIAESLSIKDLSQPASSPPPSQYVVEPLSNFKLSPCTLTALKAQKIDGLFPIQAATFSAIMAGNDVIAKARTGTGKTLAFVLPMIEIVKSLKDAKTFDSLNCPTPHALIMCPTRELARQVHTVLSSLAFPMRSACIYGGTPYGPQLAALHKGVHFVVGTPGRIIDMLNDGKFSVGSLRAICLDEADHMLDIGFADAIETIFETIRKTQLRARESDNQSALAPPLQTLLFSATFPERIKSISQKYLRKERQLIDMVGDGASQAVQSSSFLAFPCAAANVASVVPDVIRLHCNYDNGGRVVVFADTRMEVDQMAQTLGAYQSWFKTAPLHGEISQGSREATLAAFRTGKIQCIVATDIAARGIDVPNIDLVIHVRPPPTVDQFLHRSGRTGRAGKTGTVVTLFDIDREAALLRSFAKQAKINFQYRAPPRLTDIVSFVGKQIADTAKLMPLETIQLFHDRALKLRSEMGSDVDALAALMAFASNIQNVRDRSVLSGSSDLVTVEVMPKANGPLLPQSIRAFLDSLSDSKSRVMVNSGRVWESFEVDGSKRGFVLEVKADFVPLFSTKLQETYTVTTPATVPNLYNPNSFSSSPRNSSSHFDRRSSNRGNSQSGGGYRGNSQSGGGYRGNSQSGGGYRGNSQGGGGYRGNSQGGEYRSNPQGGDYRSNPQGGEYRGTPQSGGGYRGNSQSGGGYRGNSQSGEYRNNPQGGGNRFKSSVEPY